MKLVKDIRTNSEVWVTDAEEKTNAFFELIETVKDALKVAEPAIDKIEDIIEDLTGVDVDLNGNEPKKTKAKSKTQPKAPKKSQADKDYGDGAEVEIKSAGPIEIEQDIE